MTNKNTPIGTHIRTAREKAALSQIDLAKAVGFESATAISLIESGTRGVAAETLKKIAEVLKVDVKTLLGQQPDQVDVIVALRADKDLDDTAKTYIESFIQRAKQHGNG
jgi:transcriptional regulator with XRE-family HTH domain